MSYVYFILDSLSNAIKIGYADSIDSRLISLQVGNPRDLELLHYIECKNSEHSRLVEDSYHKQFEHLHIRGEWFKYDESMFRDLFLREGSSRYEQL